MLLNITGPALAQAIQAMEHEASISSFETEDLLQQMELQQLRGELEKATLTLESSLNNLLSWFRWISFAISSVITFVEVTGLAYCLRQ